MRLQVCPDFHIFIAERGLEGRDKDPSVLHELPDPLDRPVRNRIERRHDEEIVLLEPRVVLKNDIALRIHVEQAVVDRPQHIIVIQRSAVAADRVDPEKTQRGVGRVADEDRGFIFLFETGQVIAEPLPGVSDEGGFAVDRIFLKVMTQDTLPVGLEGVMNRVPVPVLDHAGAARDVAHRLQVQLSRIRRPPGIPLRFRLQHEVVVIFEAADDVAAERDLLAGQLVLARVINIAARHRQVLRDLVVLAVRLHAVRVIAPAEIKVVRDELVLPLVLPHHGGLPAEEIRHQLPAVAVELRRERPVDRASHVRKILPAVHPVAPVVESESRIHLLDVAVELLLQPGNEPLLHMPARNPVIFRLVVDLEPDHAFSVRGHLQELPDHAVCVA